jgi:hypothetical protein
MDNSRPRIVAEYDYKDEGGRLLYQVVRYAPKDFKQRRRDGNGWVWGLGNVRRVLYRLPDLQGKLTVFVTEGEKDADALHAIGLPATTSPAGAGKWRGEYAGQLKAAAVDRVVILPDADDAGRQHADIVSQSCHSAGLAVKVITLPNLPPKGDVSDWLAAGGTRPALLELVKAEPIYAPPDTTSDVDNTPRGRALILTAASDITPRPVRWLWEGRLALGTFNLLGGREGIGKSIVEATLTADITRGRLRGDLFGTPKSVIIAATEDSWTHTVVPRLIAAGADLTRVYRVDVEAPGGGESPLLLPRDLPEIELAIAQTDTAALMLDPVMSRLDVTLDSHKDGEVRQALEPLVKIAERTNCTVLGLIHVNKSTSSDPLTTLMASRAFAAVARAVLFVMVDPHDEQTRLLGTPKNNLGRSDLPTLAFTIDGAKVAETAEGDVWTGRLAWAGESEMTIREALQVAAESRGDKTAVGEASDWLNDYLVGQGGTADSADVKREAKKAGHAHAALQRARIKLNVGAISVGFPRRTQWCQSSRARGETATTATTRTTTANHVVPVVPVVPVVSVVEPLQEGATTDVAPEPVGTWEGATNGRF